MRSTQHFLKTFQWTVLCAFIFTFLACSSDVSEIKTEKNELDSLLLTGIDQMQALDFKQSSNTLTSLQKRALADGNVKYEILANINLGNLYLRFNTFEKAIDYFFKAEDLARNKNQLQYLNTIYNNIGIVYSSNGAYDKALKYFNKALAISKKQGNDLRTAMNLNNIGNLQEEINQNEEALSSFAKALEYAEKVNDSLNISHAYNNTGNIYFKKEEYGLALEKYLKAYTYVKQSEDPFYVSEYSLNLGKTYIELAQYDTARFYLEKAAEGFNNMGDIEQLIEVNKWLYEYALNEGNSFNAMEYLQRNLRWKDSLIQSKNSQWVSEFQMNYEYGKKVKELELLKEEARLQRILWISGVVVLLIIASLVVYLFKTRNQNLRQRNVILEQEREMDELAIERNQERQSRLEQRIKNDRQLNKLEKMRLKQEIEYRDRILASKALHLAQLSETMHALSDIISELAGYEDKQISHLHSRAKSILRNMETTEQEWDSFFKHFEEVHPNFFSELSADYPHLNSNDLKLCAYYVIGLSTKEIAQILHISPASVRKRKQRLRDKMNLSSGSIIADLLEKYKKTADLSEE